MAWESLYNLTDYHWRWTVGPRITDALILGLELVNRTRDNQLANRLRELANRYDTRPRVVP